ncbi:MAG: hypothetical protein H7258_01815 [Ferruginibacter sp.]|nr:hypothetical protein [Ferruginibacter sp.]
MERFLTILFFQFICTFNFAQSTPFILKGALKENRQHLYRNLVNNVINKNLALPLTDSTEELWQDAFWAMELLHYRSAWTDNRIHSAFSNIQHNSQAFQRALLELAFSNYSGIFLKQIKHIMLQAKDSRIFAMCAVYILSTEQSSTEIALLKQNTSGRLRNDKEDPILQQLQYQLQQSSPDFPVPSIRSLFSKRFLPGNVLIISVQRSNRNYPGLVVVRDSEGDFIKDDTRFFSVPQLARSVSNLPGYLTNGNTPEGIFRMDGFDTSQSNFIGPTTNIQLTLPFENSVAHFFKDSLVKDSSWHIDQYKNLLPAELKNYFPLQQSYFAGKAGRTEIIAHGTTIDPAYYRNKPYFPLTPTQGCLCTKEIWNEETGRLSESDQQKLVDAVIKAGGPYGYAIVVNLDNQQRAVTLAEINDFMSLERKD